MMLLFLLIYLYVSVLKAASIYKLLRNWQKYNEKNSKIYLSSINSLNVFSVLLTKRRWGDFLTSHILLLSQSMINNYFKSCVCFIFYFTYFSSIVVCFPHLLHCLCRTIIIIILQLLSIHACALCIKGTFNPTTNK